MWLHNPATGEIARVNDDGSASEGRRLDVDLWLQPGAAVAGAHVHDQIIERFDVKEGEIGVRVADELFAQARAAAV